MRLLRIIVQLGACPQTPGIYRFFSPEWISRTQGDRPRLSPAFPAAEPVARVASQHCPIPSDSGTPIINRRRCGLNQRSANGDSPLNWLPHAGGSVQGVKETSGCAAGAERTYTTGPIATN